MKRVICSSFFFLLILVGLNLSWTQSNEQSENLLDKLFQINTVVGGWRSPSPKWSPDGSQIVFESRLNDGGLVSINAEGGFPKRLSANVGKTGYFHLYHDPRWSPDGKWISYISAKSGTREIWLWSVKDGHDLRLTNLGGQISALNWSPDSKWISLSSDHNGNFDIWRVAVPSGEVLCLTSDNLNEVYPAWTPDSKKIFYVRMDERWIDHDIIEITVDGQKPRLIVSDKDFFDYGAGRTFGYPLISPDGKKVVFPSHRSGWINFWIVPVEGGDPRPIAPEEADQSEAKWSPDGRSIAYISNHNGTKSLHVVPAEGGKPRILVAPQIGICGSPEWSPDGTRISYIFSSLNKPKDLYVVYLKNGEKKQLTFSMPAGNLEKSLIMPEKITYKSSDDLIIHAYLYKPESNLPEKKFPGIVWIHGGPTAQFEDIFQHQPQSSQKSVQFIVQNGYVVLQPNIRGSSGYGKAFQKGNHGCWGECDLEDVLGGVKYLQSLPFVDDDRIGVTGRAYGGMMTVAAAMNAPGVFKAAVAESIYYDYELGDLKMNAELRQKLFNLEKVENIKTPILIIRGEDGDPTRPETELLVEELTKHRKLFQYNTYPEEAYYVFRTKNRQQMLLDKLKFYDKYLKR